MNAHITYFRIAPAKFYKNFVSRKITNWHGANAFSINNPTWEPLSKCLETKIGTTIMFHMFRDCAALTELSIEFCACDSLLKLLGERAPNLK